MTAARWISAVAAGLFLATLPFWRYLPLAGAPGAHMDHEPRHGGQLGMVGEHHVEVVRRRGRIEVFVSDARRRAVRPKDVSATFDHHATEALAWERQRFVGPDESAARQVEARVVLPDAATITVGFDFTEDTRTHSLSDATDSRTH